MKTAILYRSHHGTTARVVRILAEKLRGHQVTLIDLHDNPDPQIDGFDTIIIGGSIHIGMIQKSVRQFCEKNLDVLLQKETGLFICCMLKEKEQEQYERAFPEALRAHSKVHGFFGGELLLERMNCLEKFIVKKVAKTKESTSRIDLGAIGHFARKLLNKEESRNLITEKAKL